MSVVGQNRLRKKCKYLCPIWIKARTPKIKKLSPNLY